ncbi:MAG: ABC transporter ATP-binding protein, partial [Bacteroidia bacterium]|nr:ABC transporter ATP-binding protein [Bacteroidia bacterium]
TMSFLSPTISTVMNITYLAVYLVGFAILDNQPLSTGVFQTFSDAIVISQYIMHIMMSFLMFGMIFIMVPRASASANRILEVLNTKPTIADPVSPVALPEAKGIVEFDNVSFKFPESLEPTLCDISFKTKPGTVTAIIGSTGSGKSTVINLIPRLYDISQGSVKIDGVDVREYSQKDLRDKIGFVPQQAQLFSGTIRENMLFGNEHATDDEIEKALDVAQAKHFVSKLEKGLDTYVSQGGKNFSGGQKQRLSIARALVKKPEIYIFDDSFSALDFKTDIRLRTALKDYTKNSSVIIVAQRVSSIIDADQIVVLHEGKVVGVGKHERLLAKCTVYQEIVLSQLDADEVNKTIALQKQVLQSEGGAE